MQKSKYLTILALLGVSQVSTRQSRSSLSQIKASSNQEVSEYCPQSYFEEPLSMHEKKSNGPDRVYGVDAEEAQSAVDQCINLI
jgi:hypothetical protein